MGERERGERTGRGERRVVEKFLEKGIRERESGVEGPRGTRGERTGGTT